MSADPAETERRLRDEPPTLARSVEIEPSGSVLAEHAATELRARREEVVEATDAEVRAAVPEVGR